MDMPVSHGDTVTGASGAGNITPLWLQLLRDALEKAKGNKAAVARQLDVSRATVSLAVDGKYPAKTDKLAARVMEKLGRIACPALGEEISRIQCNGYAQRPAPTNNPREMRHWRACRTCPHNQGGHHAA